MNKDEALKMAIEALLYGTGHTNAVKACKEALEQPAQSITEGATMFKQVGNSPKPSPPPPIHTCIYSRTMNQEYPRKCVQCGKVETLEQPAQEPVAWTTTFDTTNIWESSESPGAPFIVALYTHPFQWQGLTDDEMWAIEAMCLVGNPADWEVEPKRFARAIEQALKEKNT